MIHQGGYLVIEERDEVQFSQIKNDFRICGGIIVQANLPREYPCCYRRVESFDSHFCDYWVSCHINHCVEEYSDFIQMHSKRLNEIKTMFNIKEDE